MARVYKPKKLTTKLGDYCHSHYGLTLESVELMGLELISPEFRSSQFPDWLKVESIRIPYYRHGIKPHKNDPKRPFCRYRRIGQSPTFTELPKYTQEAGTSTHIYYPPLIDWPEVLSTTDNSLIITEGEFKAARACQDGLPTLGLGGVWNWRATKEFHPDLEEINWSKRRVYIIYDSDISQNPQVAHAAVALAIELLNRGADSRIVMLPQMEDDTKQGLDDYLNREGLEALYHHMELAPSCGDIRPMLAINAKHLKVQSLGKIIHRESGNSISESFLRLTTHLCTLPHFDGRTGEIKMRKVPAGKAWLEWPLKATVDDLIYRPGQEPLLYEQGRAYYNTWPGLAVGPVRGSVKPFYELLDHLFGDTDYRWFLQWLAYPLQHPGVKLPTAVVMAGRVHGTGKSLIGVTMGAIYGKNYTTISQKALESDFNYEMTNKQFLMGDEITGHKSAREFADRLKEMITRETMWVNHKNLPRYEVPDCINYYFTTNHNDSFYLEEHDRRFFYHWVQAGVKPPEFYTRYMEWLRGTGPSHLLYELLHLDMSGFNPGGHAPSTESKHEAIYNAMSNLQAQLTDIISGEADPFPQRDLYSPTELLQILDPEGRWGYTTRGIGRRLAQMGLPQVQVPSTSSGGKVMHVKYYALRYAKKWINASLAERAAHIEKNPLIKSKKY